MEFLNTIWNAVSTPNQTIINIFSIFAAYFIEIPLTFLLITSILKLNYTKKQKYIYIISVATITLINMFVLQNPFNIVFNYISNFAIIYLIFNNRNIKIL